MVSCMWRLPGVKQADAVHDLSCIPHLAACYLLTLLSVCLPCLQYSRPKLIQGWRAARYVQYIFRATTERFASWLRMFFITTEGKLAFRTFCCLCSAYYSKRAQQIIAIWN